MARVPDLERFSAKHGIPIVTIADIVTFRLMKESLIEELSSGTLQTMHGQFRARLFRSLSDGLTHVAIVKGDAFESSTVDVRVHRQRPFVDVFGQAQASGPGRIDYGLQMLRETDAGVFLYLTHSEPQGGLASEFGALVAAEPAPPMPARPWTEMDPHMLGIGAQILRHIGVRRMRVHMTHPTPLKGLGGFDLEVVDTHEIKGEAQGPNDSNDQADTADSGDTRARVGASRRIPQES
jgi:3,4-dihydroxy 2-butanone 4-phosphate synthase/GTP cyclohydrolase II